MSEPLPIDLARASTLTLTGPAAEVVDRVNARFNPRCRAGGTRAGQGRRQLLAGAKADGEMAPRLSPQGIDGTLSRQIWNRSFRSTR